MSSHARQKDLLQKSPAGFARLEQLKAGKILFKSSNKDDCTHLIVEKLKIYAKFPL